MKINDIDKLIKDSSGNYDLTQLTFKSDLSTVAYSFYEVQEGEEMRIDLVCQSIYNNTEYIDILLNVNGIDNPLNIKRGLILAYPTNYIESLRYSDERNETTIDILANTNKQQRKDKNRKQYVENKLSLPPTILNERTQQFDISSDIITLGDGLF